MTEATEMYLLRIGLLSQQDDPVPVSALAAELEISPVSANQMCRKLEERGLVEYQPYKGVRLTDEGKLIARRILRKRRLWEVFMVDKLGATAQDAEEIACRFEHVTPDELSERLADYLGDPAFSPQRQPIPPRPGQEGSEPTQPLAALAAGAQATIVSIPSEEVYKQFLHSHGIRPGATIKVLAKAANGPLLASVAGRRLTLAQEIAVEIAVSLYAEEVLSR